MDYLSARDLAAALGGKDRLRTFYDITPRDTAEEVAACIIAACEDYGIAIGKGDPKQPFTFSSDVRDLADRLRGATRVIDPFSVPTLGTLETLSFTLRRAA